MDISSKADRYFRTVLQRLPSYPFFAPDEKHPEGKTEALKRCQTAISNLLSGNLGKLEQAHLEFLVRVCDGKDQPLCQGAPFTDLLPIRQRIVGFLQAKFYTQRSDKQSIAS